MNINIYKSIFCKFSFGLIVSFVVFFVFSHPASADYYDYIPGVGEVKVEWVGVVNGVPTVNIKDESGNIIASGAKVTINEEGRGVPDLNDLMAKSNNIITTAIEPPTYGQISDAFGNPIIDESVRYYEQFGATNPNVLQEVLFGYVDNPANPIYGLQTGASPREVVTVVLRNEGIITDPDMSWDAAKNLLISAGIEVSDRNLTISDINQILSALNLPTTLNIEDNNGDGIIQREELFNSVTHNVCSGNLCVSVAGAGADQCSSNADCAPLEITCQRCSNVNKYAWAQWLSGPDGLCDTPDDNYGTVTYTCNCACTAGSNTSWNPSCVASCAPSPNQPPSATNLKVTQPDYCTISWPAAILSWNFTDPDGDTQSAYQVQVDNNSDFSSPEVDTNKVISSSQSYATLSGVLSWNTTYYWRLKVWDSKNLSSSWISGSSFATPRHQYPTINFSWFPLNPAVNGSVQFTDSSIVFGGASKSEWQWTFTDAAPPVSNQENPTTKFLSSANKSATLKMTDSDGFSCEGQRTISVQLPPPEWIEIAPF